MAVFEMDQTVDTLVLSDKAFTTYQFASWRFYGCLQVMNSSGTAHETILDGLKYVYGDPDERGRLTVKVTDDIRVTPAIALGKSVKDNLSLPILRKLNFERESYGQCRRPAEAEGIRNRHDALAGRCDPKCCQY